MNSLFETRQLITGLVSVVLSFGFAYFLKDWLRSYRKPNGKKGGVVSLQTVIAFSIITVIALVTKDPVLTGLTVILAYFISRNQIENKQSFIYQIVVSILVGVGVPYLVFWVVDEKLGGKPSYTMIESEREYYPENDDKDYRYEADDAPELRLETEHETDYEENSPMDSPIPSNLSDEEQEFLREIENS